MKYLKLFMISAISFLALLSANFVFADNFHLSQDNEKELIAINKRLSEESESLIIYVDGQKLSPTSTWHVSDTAIYENKLEIDTSKKSVKFDSRTFTLSTNKQSQLRDQLIQNLSDGHSVNEALQKFLVSYRNAINHEEHMSAKELIAPVIVTIAVFALAAAALLMIDKYSKRDYH